MSLFQLVQFRPGRAFPSVTFSIPAGTPGAPAGLPLNNVLFNVFVAGSPANSDLAVEQIIIHHDAASTGVLVVGAPAACVMPIVAGSYFSLVASRLSEVALGNTDGANAATGSILLILSEPD